MSTAIPFLVLAVGLVVLGRWGRRQADQVVPASLPENERRRRADVVRRGAVCSYVVAAIFVCFALAALI